MIAKRLSRRRLLITVGLAAFAILAVLAAPRVRGMVHAVAHLSPVYIGSFVALSLIPLLFRAEAFKLSFSTSSALGSDREMCHCATACTFAASTINNYTSRLARVAVIRRASEGSEPPPAVQVLVAEAPVLLAEGLAMALLVCAVGWTGGLPWWVGVVMLTAIAASVVALARWQRRAGDAGAGAKGSLRLGLSVLRRPDVGLKIALLGMAVVLIQVARMWTMLHAVGLHPTAFDAAAMQASAATISILPVGALAEPAGAAIALQRHSLAAALGAGSAVAAGGACAAVIYTVVAGALVLHRRRRRAQTAVE
jgi:hypothetical protein